MTTSRDEAIVQLLYVVSKKNIDIDTSIWCIKLKKLQGVSGTELAGSIPKWLQQVMAEWLVAASSQPQLRQAHIARATDCLDTRRVLLLCGVVAYSYSCIYPETSIGTGVTRKRYTTPGPVYAHTLQQNQQNE